MTMNIAPANRIDVYKRQKYKLVLLNKIDMLWDDLKPKQDVTNEIEKQVNITAHQLSLIHI